MTRSVQIYAKSAFSAWLKDYGPSSSEGRDGIDIQDIDFVIFCYLTGDLMTVEAKEKGGSVPMAQADTQNILRQLLARSSGAMVNTKRGIRPIRYHGHHLIQFQNSTPDDGWIRLDGKDVTREQLIMFLNFYRPLKRTLMPGADMNTSRVY